MRVCAEEAGRTRAVANAGRSRRVLSVCWGQRKLTDAGTAGSVATQRGTQRGIQKQVRHAEAAMHGVTYLMHNGVILSFVGLRASVHVSPPPRHETLSLTVRLLCKRGHSRMQKEAHRQYEVGIPIKRVGGRDASKDFIVLLSQAKSNHQNFAECGCL